MARRRVAHIIDSLNLGGAEKVVVEIANRLNPSIFEAHLIATTVEGPRLTELLPHVKYFYLAKKHRYDIRAFHRLISYLDENEIKVVHTHQQTGACLYSIACKLFRRKQIHVHSDHNPEEEDWKSRPQIKRWLITHISK